MMDHFDKKREMVKALQDALKKSAGDEMAKAHPQMVDLTKTNKMQQKTSDSSMMSDGGMADQQPHPMSDEDMAKKQSGQMTSEEEAAMAKQQAAAGYSDGGMASPTDEPEREMMPRTQDADGSADMTALENLPTSPEDDDMEKDDAQQMHNENMEMEDEDNNSSAFDAFMPRKKKK